MTRMARTPPGVAAEERALISAMLSGITRSPFQVNTAFETDAELLDLGNSELMALTVDTLNHGGELATARTPYEKGWLTTAVSMSDLCAVGAKGIGVLVSCCVPRRRWSSGDAYDFGRGASDAAEAHQCHVLGGDTNWADEESFTSCAVGRVPKDRLLRRRGARPGDRLYVTGAIGAGNAAGLRNVMGRVDQSQPWLPVARSAAVEPLREYARACVDTSDGLLRSAMILAEAGDLGMDIHAENDIYHPSAEELLIEYDLPNWLLSAGEWGEYELLYAIAPENEQQCMDALSLRGVSAVQVGNLNRGPNMRLHDQSGKPQDIRTLLQRMQGINIDGHLLESLRQLVTRRS